MRGAGVAGGKIQGAYVVTCGECLNAGILLDAKSWSEAHDAARRLGFQLVNSPRRWAWVCQGCREGSESA